SKKLLRILKRLIRVPGNEVMIVSGRPKYALDAWFKSLPVTLVAEHGAWIRNRGVWSVRSDFPTDWKEPLMHILQIATERTPGALIEDKTFSLVWHYRNVTPELAYIRKAGIMHDAEKFLRDSEIDVFEGHQVLEFKPRFITKGTAAKQKMGEGGHDFILAIGDDYTDEDLFEALPPGAFTIKVGLTSSKARYHLATVEHVLAFISQLSKAVPEPPAALTEDAKHEPDVKRRDHKGDPAGRKP
ncbi:MAG TPA: trehalose-phosphatase, partial [Candidatus Saccharimonadia bacterium]|nr:trehalose-phosphatase [Candidatus Saccharimonadia bacterium]